MTEPSPRLRSSSGGRSSVVRIGIQAPSGGLAQKPCIECGTNTEDYLRCDCGLVYYCSVECKKLHYPKHVDNCLQESDKQTKLRRANPDVVVFSSAHIVDFTKHEYDVSFAGFLRSMKAKFRRSPPILFEPFKQHSLTDDVLCLGSIVGRPCVSSLGHLAVTSLVQQFNKLPPSQLPKERAPHLANLPVECLIQVAFYALFRTMSDDDIELGICLDELDPVLEQALFASRIQQQTATNPSDLEKLVYIELLCMRELETSELTKPPPTDDFVSVLLTKLIPTEPTEYLSITTLKTILQCGLIQMEQRRYRAAEKTLKYLCENLSHQIQEAEIESEDDVDEVGSSSSSSSPESVWNGATPSTSPFEVALLSGGPVVTDADIDLTTHPRTLRILWLYLIATKNLGLVHIYLGYPGKACKSLEQAYRSWQRFLHPKDKRNKKSSLCKCCFWKRFATPEAMKYDFGCFGMQYLLYLNSISFRIKGLKEDSRIQAASLEALSDSESSSSSEDDDKPAFLAHDTKRTTKEKENDKNTNVH